jgi:hypothetical protein
VPEEVAKKLPALKGLSEATSQDLFVAGALKRLGPLVQQAELLAAQYDAVVAIPPVRLLSPGRNVVLQHHRPGKSRLGAHLARALDHRLLGLATEPDHG